MKKLLILTLVIMLCVMCAACQNTVNNTQETTIHTLPPTDATTVEYEWVEIDCEITLLDSEKNPVLLSEDFETFTLVGSNDNDSSIIVKLKSTCADMLTKTLEGATDTLTLAIEGESVAQVTIDPATFNGEIEFGSEISFEDLCELATTIRGLFN